MSAENKQVTFGSGKREIPAQKASKWYPAEDEPVNKKVSYFLNLSGLFSIGGLGTATGKWKEMADW